MCRLNHNSLVIYGSDGKHCDVESMIARVNENRTLKDKPKLIFMVLNRCDHKMFKAAGEHVLTAIRKSKVKIGDCTFLYYIIVVQLVEVEVEVEIWANCSLPNCMTYC